LIGSILAFDDFLAPKARENRAISHFMGHSSMMALHAIVPLLMIAIASD
jgi:hypothetical protein